MAPPSKCDFAENMKMYFFKSFQTTTDFFQTEYMYVVELSEQ